MKVRPHIPQNKNYLFRSLSAILYCLKRRKVKRSPVKLSMPLLFAGHGDGPFGTDEGADAAAFAEIVIDFNVAGLRIPGNAEIRTEVAAQVAGAAKIIPKAPARLHDRRFFIKTRFDLIQIFGVRLLVPAPDFQFARFSHSRFLRFTAKSQRTQRECFCSPFSFAGFFLSTMLRTSRSRDRDAARRAEKNSLRSPRLCGESFQVSVYSLGGFLAARHGFNHRARSVDKISCGKNSVHVHL